MGHSMSNQHTHTHTEKKDHDPSKNLAKCGSYIVSLETLSLSVLHVVSKLEPAKKSIFCQILAYPLVLMQYIQKHIGGFNHRVVTQLQSNCGYESFTLVLRLIA